MMTDKSDSSPLLTALERILRPIVRLALKNRIRFQQLSEMLKRLYVMSAEDEAQQPEKRLTDSRISLLTGLQRKDIKTIRTVNQASTPTTSTIGPIPRIIAHWKNSTGYQDGTGNPLVLPKTGPKPSFEALIEMVSRDIHPRTVLNELQELSIVKVDDNQITLLVDAFIPGADKAASVIYLGNNLGDHASAAVDNILTTNQPAPYFERAVHYNQLSDKSVRELAALSRKLQKEALETINARALELQDQDQSQNNAVNRFRCGTYIYHLPIADPSDQEEK